MKMVLLLVAAECLVTTVSTSTPSTTAQTPPSSTWTGVINFNANLAVSVQDAQSIFLDSRATQRLLGGGVFDITGLYILSRQTVGSPKTFATTEDRFLFTGRYDTPTNGRKFGFITQSVEQNKIVNLSLRHVTSAGFGVVMLQTPEVAKTGEIGRPGDAEWRLNAGVSYLREEYLQNLGERTQYGLQFSSLFRRVFSRGIDISHSITFTPAFEDASDFVLFSNLSVAFPINPRTRLTLNYIVDFDTTPAPGSRQDNYKYAISLGYRF